jgi:hypothetical protein
LTLISRIERVIVDVATEGEQAIEGEPLIIEGDATRSH